LKTKQNNDKLKKNYSPSSLSENYKSQQFAFPSSPRPHTAPALIPVIHNWKHPDKKKTIRNNKTKEMNPRFSPSAIYERHLESFPPHYHLVSLGESPDLVGDPPPDPALSSIS